MQFCRHRDEGFLSLPLLIFVQLVNGYYCDRGWREFAIRRFPEFFNSWLSFNGNAEMDQDVGMYQQSQPPYLQNIFLPEEVHPHESYDDAGYFAVEPISTEFRMREPLPPVPPLPTQLEVHRYQNQLMSNKLSPISNKDGEEELPVREEVFSYSPHVVGSGFQNQPSYDDVPQLSKSDISRYASIYKYDWQENERSSPTDHHQPVDESISPSPSLPSVLRTTRAEFFSRIDAKTEPELVRRMPKLMVERQVLVTRKLNTESTFSEDERFSPIWTPTSSQQPTTIGTTEATETTVAPNETTMSTTMQATSQAPETTTNPRIEKNTTQASEVTTNRSTQVPIESVKDMMRMLKKPVGLFENKLFKLREQRMKKMTNARGKPRKAESILSTPPPTDIDIDSSTTTKIPCGKFNIYHRY